VSKVISKQTQKEQVDAIASAVAETMKKTIDEQVDTTKDDSKLFYKNAEGKMLMCELTMARRENAPDPFLTTTNEEIRWIKRGQPVIVPWYVVDQLKNNKERKFRTEKDEQGKKVVVFEDIPTESFQYHAINPAPGVNF